MNTLLLRASKIHTNHIRYSFENDFKIILEKYKGINFLMEQNVEYR